MAGRTAKSAAVVIVDFGSQYTQLICRRTRELGIYSRLVPGNAPLERIREGDPRAVIISGGPNSVLAEGSPALPAGFFEWAASAGVAVLGICYGMQLIVHALGGEVTAAGDNREYGSTNISTAPSVLFHGAAARDAASPHGPRATYAATAGTQDVWMSHGDEVLRLPAGFQTVANSQQGTIVAIENRERNIFGLQYHPEVTHTPKGVETLQNFLAGAAGLKEGSWTMGDVLKEQVEACKQQVPPGAHAIAALSGGVDSMVAATLIHRALGERLHCIFVDNGLLRHKERERVVQMFEDGELKFAVDCVDDSRETLDRLQGVTDPEAKRRAIGARFIEVFRKYKQDVEARTGAPARFLVQGTLYPDVIESLPPPGSDQIHSHTIKTHHNVGGLPKDLGFDLIEPLRMLFKDEVRALGALLGVPAAFLKRHPFPGPGLAVRIMGDVTAPGALETLRAVDDIFVSAIKKAGLYDDIWQAFAVFLPVKTVGVQGDQRSHANAVGLRAVCSSDGMTADWYAFEPSFLRAVSTKICNDVPGVNRVVLDITSKPPSTIEWE